MAARPEGADGAAPAAARLAGLRAALGARGLDGFVLPRAGENPGEAVPASAERLAWLTGFDGSAGLAVVLADGAAVFVDGRYTLQVRAQVDPALYEARHIGEEPPTAWIAERLGAGGRLGYDPWLHTVDEAERLREAAGAAGGSLVPVEPNPVDALWTGRPAPPLAPAVPHGIEYAGRDSADKRLEIAEILAANGLDAAVFSAPESIAWLLNIRGDDVPRTPVALGYAILDRTGAVDLFMDGRKLDGAARAHLGNAATVRPPDALGPAIDELARAGRAARIDPGATPDWIARRIEAAGGAPARGPDPSALPRARKNEVELAGARAAHLRDGAAFARFLHWFAGEAPKGTLDEIAAAERLRAFRAEQALFRDLSFDTISAAGPHGAIVHYRVTPESNRPIRPGDLYLVDSGAQYLDGTTDITRTIAVGDPGAEARDRFTRVLKGHIAIATARFPEGAAGDRLDPLARAPLWRAGLDFDHGTGHGVGSYLGVHEGPQGISPRARGIALEPGMIVSNEPGFYKEGAWGIRLENLVAVTAPRRMAGGDRDTMAFETLTLAPFDRSMVDPGLLEREELRWLNGYHARVRDRLSPLVPPETAAWLARATAEIG